MFRNITLLGVFFLLLLNSCKVTKHISEEEQLLVKNSIVFEKGYKIENKEALKTEMSSLYKQEPNKKKLLFFKTNLWLYFLLKNSEADTMRIKIDKNGIPDTIEETNLEKALRKIALKRWSEPPAIFEEELMEETRQNMNYFLRNRGYYESEVEASVYSPPEGRRKQRISKKVEVTYLLKPKRRIKIDTIEFFSEDSEVHRIINAAAYNTFLKKGAPVDEKLYDLEVNRITTLLRNKGYARFTPNYIPKLIGDTTNFKAKLKFRVSPPGKGEVHKKYRIGHVKIVPEYKPFATNLTDTLIGDFQFIKEKDTEFWLKPRILAESVFLKTGSLYQQSLLIKTNRKLGDLGIFNFINIRQEIDSTQENVINFDILLSPRKKYESGYDIEPNWTERSLPTSRVNLLGLAAGLYFGNKNTFRGAEYLSSNLYSGFEFDLNRNNGGSILNTIDLKANADINIPRFNDYLGLYKLLRKAKILRKPFYDNMTENARTLIRSGYNYASLFNFYDLHSFNAGMGYDMQSQNNRFQINNLSIDILQPTFKSSIQPVLDDNLFLKNSFGDQLFSGFLFRDISYIFNSKTNSFGERYLFQINTEVSGAEIYGINKLYNALTDNSTPFMLGNTLEFSQYGRVELALSYNRKINSNHAVAVRFYSGVGRPFGFTKLLPYLKQFFAGGPNSIRAWSAREIGPGSYRDPLTINPNNSFRFYQTGDFKMEINGEYRFKLFKLFIDYEGAIFLDIGNIWTFENDPQRPGSQLTWNRTKDTAGNILEDNFFRELAIGSGFGLRLDFSYFLLRLDMGLPIKNNYRTPLANNRYTYAAFPEWRKVSTTDINFNLGLNYPF